MVKNICLLILILILYYKLKNSKENFLINEDKWMKYRLGDIVGIYCPNRSRPQEKYWDKILKTLPDSIGAKYILKVKNLNAKERVNNYKILTDIMKDLNYEKPDSNDIVIHIRLGDTIKYDKKTKKFTTFKSYGTSIDEFTKTLSKINNTKRKIVIVYGAHKKNIDIEGNKKYLEEIKKILEKHGFNYELRNRDPDEDFYYMCNSKNFVSSGGGFSQKISEIVKMNGGMVYYPVEKSRRPNHNYDKC